MSNKVKYQHLMDELPYYPLILAADRADVDLVYALDEYLGEGDVHPALAEEIERVFYVVFGSEFGATEVEDVIVDLRNARDNG